MSHTPVPPTTPMPPVAPPPPPRGTSGVAVAGFVLAVVLAPVGLVLSLIALGRTGPGKAEGRGLAVSGAVISGFLVVVGLSVLGAAGAADEGGVAATPGGRDGAGPASPTGTPGEEPGAAPEQGPQQRPPEEPPQPPAPGPGDPVTVGDITYTVESVEEPGRVVGGEWYSEEALGRWVLVRVTVTNNGDAPYRFTAWDQVLHDTAGRRFEGGPGWFLVEGGEKSLWGLVNPGLTVRGAPLLYDVPADAQVDRLDLTDGGWFSTPVTVRLR